MEIKNYKPMTPHTIAAWALVKVYGQVNRATAIEMIAVVNCVHPRFTGTPQERAEGHIRWLETCGYVSWPDTPSFDNRETYIVGGEDDLVLRNLAYA